MRTKTVSARVSLEVFEKVEAMAREKGVTVSDVVREALEKELKRGKPWWRFW